MHNRTIFLFSLLFLVFLSQNGITKELIVTPAEKADHQIIRQLFTDKMPDVELEIDDFLKNYPKSPFVPEILYISAQLEWSKNVPQKASKLLMLIIENHKSSPYHEDSLFLLGKVSYAENNIPEALDSFQKLLLEYPSTKFKERTYYHLTVISLEQKQWILAHNYRSKITRKFLLRSSQKLNLLFIDFWLEDQKGNQKTARKLALDYINQNAVKNHKSSLLLLKLGDYRKAKSQWVEARINYEKALKASENPDTGLLAKFWIAEMIFAVHQQDPKRISDKLKKQALDYFTEVLENKSFKDEHATSLYHRGWIYLYFKKEHRAVEDFAKLQKTDPDFATDTDLILIRASYWEKSKEWEKAVNVLDFGIKHQKSETDLLKLRIRLIRDLVSYNNQSDQCPRIHTEIGHLATSIPKNLRDELHSYQGDCHHKNQRWSDATTAYQKVNLNSSVGPFMIDSYLESMDNLSMHKEASVILKSIEKDKRYGKPYELLEKRIRYLFLLKDWSLAIKELYRYKKLAPTYAKKPRVLIQFATAYENLGQLKKAEPFYYSAFKKLDKSEHPLKLSIADKLGAHYEQVGNTKKMLEIYTLTLPLMEEEQKDRLILFIGKTWYISLKNKKEGEKWLKKIHLKKQESFYFEASYILGEIQIASKQFNSAIKTLNALSKQNIKSTRWYIPVHYRLGELYQFHEKWNDAIRHYRVVSTSQIESQERKNARTQLYNIRKYLKQTN